MNHIYMIKPRFFQRLVQRVLHFRCGNSRAEFPSDNVPAVIIQNGRRIKPAADNHFQIGEVGLRTLIGCRRLVAELTRSLHHDKGWIGDQIMESHKQPQRQD